MTPAFQRGVRKAARTLLQVIAAGGLTALVNALAEGLPATANLAVAAGWLLVVTFAQNMLETQGSIPTVLPAPGLVTMKPGAVVTRTVGTVGSATARAGGAVAGTVADVTGGVSDFLGPRTEEAMKHPDRDEGQRGGVGMAILVFVVGFAVVLWLAIDACFNDSDERNDLGAPAWIAHHYYDDDPPPPEEDEGEPPRKCTAFVIIACGDLIIPPPIGPQPSPA